MLTRGDLERVEERMLRNLIASPPADAWRFGIRATSGTTGAPMVTLMRYRRSFDRYKNGTNVLFCFGARGLRLTRALQIRNHAGAQKALLLDAKDILPALPPLLEDFSPDTIEGVPSFVVRLCEQVTPKVAAGVREVFLFGERLGSAVEALLRRTFPKAVFHTLYLSTELGHIGTSCPHLPSLNYYHPHKGVRIKVLNPDGRGAGELLVSKQVTEEDGVEDYAIGDVARLLPGVCACGQEISFEHLGRRGHDYIKLVSALVRREEFDRVAALFPDYIDDYRAEVSQIEDKGKIKGKIVMRVYRAGGDKAGATGEIVARFSKEVFLTPTLTLADLVARGTFLPLTVEYVSEPFSRKHKDVKLKLVE